MGSRCRRILTRALCGCVVQRPQPTARPARRTGEQQPSRCLAATNVDFVGLCSIKSPAGCTGVEAQHGARLVSCTVCCASAQLHLHTAPQVPATRRRAQLTVQRVLPTPRRARRTGEAAFPLKIYILVYLLICMFECNRHTFYLMSLTVPYLVRRARPIRRQARPTRLQARHTRPRARPTRPRARLTRQQARLIRQRAQLTGASQL